MARIKEDNDEITMFSMPVREYSEHFQDGLTNSFSSQLLHKFQPVGKDEIRTVTIGKHLISIWTELGHEYTYYPHSERINIEIYKFSDPETTKILTRLRLISPIVA